MKFDNEEYDATFAPLTDIVKDYYHFVLPMEAEPLDKFDDIKPASVRAYNRLAYALNLKEDRGPKVMANYIGSFTKDDRLEMIAMWSRIMDEGIKVVRRELQDDIKGDDV